MLLRRTATALTAIGLTLTFTAPLAAAHEGHEMRNPGQNREALTIQCEGVGDVDIEVTSVGRGRGVGRIIGDPKGVLIPTAFEFFIRNAATGEDVVPSQTETFGRAEPTTTCTFEGFRGTLADLEVIDPGFAEELRAAGVSETDVLVAGGIVQVLLRGPGFTGAQR